MRLFISNFKLMGWGKSWLLALVISLFALCSLEIFWRANGHQPNIVDDQRLWAVERNKVGKSSNEIVLLGSSRMQTDTSIKLLKKDLPDYSIVNLSADGTCGNAVLYDIAEDESFNGKIIIESTPECLLFGCDPDISQQFYVDYFAKSYNLNEAINRHIATCMQKKLTIIDPYLNLIKVIGKIIVQKEKRIPNYVTTYENRTRSVDYTKTDTSNQKVERVAHAEERYKQLSTRITSELIAQNITRISEAVGKIKHRGGDIVFVRFPVSGEHWLVDQKYFPRDFYWNSFLKKIGVDAIHFKDIDEMSKLECPDTSHIDFRDKDKFTRILLVELLKREVI